MRCRIGLESEARMRKKGCNEAIRTRIAGMPAGSVFVLSDFSDVAGIKTVSKTLTRLCGAGLVEKLSRGVFWKPVGSGEPFPDNVAQALARCNCWTAVPSGDTAKHIAGIEKEAPGNWTYITDGTNRVYDFGGFVITFKHASSRFFGAMSSGTALLVQVIKALGKEALPEAVVNQLYRFFASADPKKLIDESRRTTAWIYASIKKLFAKRQNGPAVQKS